MGLLKNIAISIEEIILLIIVYLNIIEFFGIISLELDLINKSITWFALALLFYHISLTKIFFGKKNKFYDFIIVFSYFMLILKNFTGWIKAIVEESSGSLEHLFELILTHSNSIEYFGIILGFLIILVLSIIFASTIEIYSPSTLEIIHESGKPPKNIIKKIIRFFSIFLVMTGFFVVVFNLLVEWLGLVMDAPVVIAGIATYFILSIRFKSKFKASKFLYTATNFGEEFYVKFIELFQSKKIHLGIIGILTFHLLTDIGVFVIPYITSIPNEIYSGLIKEEHIPIIHHLLEEITQISGTEIIGLITAYLTNIFVFISFLIIPGLIWYAIYKSKKINFNSIFLTLFYFSLPFFLFSPLFLFKNFEEGSTRGVNVISQGIFQNSIYSLNSILIFSIIIGIIAFIITLTKLKPILDFLSFIISSIFFASYLFLFFKDISSYYMESIIFLINSNEILISFYMMIIFGITFIFYIGGFLSYIIATMRNNPE